MLENLLAMNINRVFAVPLLAPRVPNLVFAHFARKFWCFAGKFVVKNGAMHGATSRGSKDGRPACGVYKFNEFCVAVWIFLQVWIERWMESGVKWRNWREMSGEMAASENRLPSLTLSAVRQLFFRCSVIFSRFGWHTWRLSLLRETVERYFQRFPCERTRALSLPFFKSEYDQQRCTVLPLPSPWRFFLGFRWDLSAFSRQLGGDTSAL